MSGMLTALLFTLILVGPDKKWGVASQSLYCNPGRSESRDTEILPGRVLDIFPFDRDRKIENRSRHCRFQFFWNIPTQSEAIVLLELRRSDNQDVQLGDYLPNTTISFLDRKVQQEFLWGKRNFTVFKINSNKLIKIIFNFDDATAQSLDNHLFLRVTIVAESEQSKYVCLSSEKLSLRYQIRRRDFVCGSSRLTDCPDGLALAAQFENAAAIQKLASCKPILEVKGPVALGLRCCNGDVVSYHHNPWNNTSDPQWEPVTGLNSRSICNTSDSKSAVNATLTMNAISSLNESFSLNSMAGDGEYILLDLLFKLDGLRNNTAFCADPDIPTSYKFDFLYFLLLIPLAIIAIVVIIFIKQRKKTNQRSELDTSLPMLRQA